MTVLRLICIRNKHLVPIAVFDGLTPPAKKRRPSATNNNNTLKLTPEHRFSLIIRLIEHEIEYIVAPFEADSQIAIMDKFGLIDLVLTNDTDLVALGCRQVFFPDRKSSDEHITGYLFRIQAELDGKILSHHFCEASEEHRMKHRQGVENPNNPEEGESPPTCLTVA